MKDNLLQKWCDQLWLYCIYLLGVAMWCVLLIRWTAWDMPQIFICLLAVMLPLHVFEENTAPGGFFFMNNLNFRSDHPIAYPQSRLTNMITNLGAELYVIVLTIFAPRIGAPLIVTFIVFGVTETVSHTLVGIKMFNRYKDKGKTTVYGPGTITSFVCLLPASVYGCYWLYDNSVTGRDILLGIALMAVIMVFLVGLPLIISGRIKSTKYAFKNIGYFSKYEDQES